MVRSASATAKDLVKTKHARGILARLSSWKLDLLGLLRKCLNMQVPIRYQMNVCARSSDASPKRRALLHNTNVSVQSGCPYALVRISKRPFAKRLAMAVSVRKCPDYAQRESFERSFKL